MLSNVWGSVSGAQGAVCGFKGLARDCGSVHLPILQSSACGRAGWSGMNHGHEVDIRGWLQEIAAHAFGCQIVCVGSQIPVPVCLLLILHATACFRCPILVGCPAEPCSWRLYLGTLCITKNLSYMIALRRRVGDGLWYSSGVYSTCTRDGARSSHRDTDLRAFSCRHQHVAKAGDGRSCPFGEFIW